MDLEFSPSILDTPSIMTSSNNSLNSQIYNPTYTTAIDINNDNNNTIASVITTTTNDESSLSVSTAEIKLSKIENELKQSFSQSRRPTESPFQKMAQVAVLTVGKNVPVPPTTDDGMPVDVPSTADVVSDLESFSKYSTKDNIDRETTTLTSDNICYDTSPVHTMGVIVSPKKRLIMRSQSHTDPTSPTSIPSQSQKNNFDDESSIDDDDNDDHQSSINNHFQHVHDLPIMSHTNDSNGQLDNRSETYRIQVRTDPNGVYPTIIKQQPMVINNKRILQQAMIGTTIPKTNSILIPQQPIINEVTSSNQVLGIKRQKMSLMPTDTIVLRSSFPSSSTNDDNNNNNNNNNFGSDDQRKKQIRDSNREAARRCRERRRNYIEQLEGNLEQYKTQIKQVAEKLSRAERENTQLRAILTETNMFHTTSRLSSNESIVDFANVIASTNGIELKSELIHRNDLRNYNTRNTH